MNKNVFPSPTVAEATENSLESTRGGRASRGGRRQKTDLQQQQRSEVRAFTSQTSGRQVTLTEEDSRQPQSGDEDGEILGTVGSAGRGSGAAASTLRRPALINTNKMINN